jgi:hypothetical protein
MKRKVLIGAILLLSLYFLSYIWLRQSRSEVWEKGGKVYVIFPENKILYLLFRPVSYLDNKMTGIGFHVGRHR